MKFKDNEIIPDASTSLEFLGYAPVTINGGFAMAISLEYKDNIYTVLAETENYTTLDVIKPKITGKKKIFEGPIDITNGTELDIPSLTEEVSLSKKYMLDVTINGEQKSLVTVYSIGLVLVLSHMSYPIGIVGNNVYISSNFSGSIILNNIYEIGEAENCVAEDEFVLYCRGFYNDGILVGTPNTSYEVPTTVAGRTVESIAMDSISGIPTFTTPVNLYFIDLSDVCPQSIKITTPDLDFFFTPYINTYYYNLQELDLSECGDNITIPEEFLAKYTNVTIYVTSAVKEKYQDYSNVIVK